MYKAVFLDMDGTVLDSKPGVCNSIRYALSALGYPSMKDEELTEALGPSLYYSFEHICHLPKEKVDAAVAAYRDYYDDRGIWEGELFPGIPELVKALKEKGFTVALATGKPEHFARRILERHGLLPYFDFVAGSTFDEKTRAKKEEVLRYAMENVGNPSPADCLMVGDRRFDAEGAHLLGMACCGVLFGYGSQEELEAAGADYIVPTPDDVLKIALMCK